MRHHARRGRRAAALPVWGLLAAGCAWGGVSRPSVGHVGQVAAAASSRQSRAIALWELEEQRDLALLTAIRRLRPRLLDPGKPTLSAPGGESPAVYLDGVLQGGILALDGIPASRTREVRRLSETEAFAWYGRRHAGGALQVTSR